MINTGIIKSIKKETHNSYKEKSSEFIADAFPVNSEDEVNQHLTEIKKKYYDASHHCYAFRLKSGSIRYSDAGEPNGTAGIRILNAIDHMELKDTLVIVTRYFGGTKLGIGPLGKAYYKSAELVLENCEVVELKPFHQISIHADFSFISEVHRAVNNCDGIMGNIEYKEDVIFQAMIPLNKIVEMSNELTETGAGKIIIEMNENIIYHTC